MPSTGLRVWVMSLTFVGRVQLRKQNLGQLLEDSGLLPAV